jgi:hypothetical protein
VGAVFNGNNSPKNDHGEEKLIFGTKNEMNGLVWEIPEPLERRLVGPI